MRLVSLKVEPLGQNGWESQLLEFGDRTTLIFAENGSGKTPIIQSVAACLGFPLKFRDEIFGKCSSIILRAENDGEAITVQRFLGSSNREFRAVLTYKGQESEYLSEGAFSLALFEVLGFAPPRLVSNKGEVAQPYISTVLPVFYLNQSDGYTAAYKSANSFIQDQFVEMVRFVFDLNPKHSFDVKKNLIEEKLALDAQTRKIVATQRVLEYQSKDIDDSDANQRVLQQNASELTSQIEALRQTVDAQGTASSALNELLRQKEVQIRSKQNELLELQTRVSGIDAIRAEIEGEVNTLGLNEEARRVFSSFHEICGVANCGVFVGTTESYGKNLLYLRDQIKDLDRNTVRAELRIEQLEYLLVELQADHKHFSKN